MLARPASSPRVEPEAGYFPLCRVCHYSFSLFVILIAELSSDTRQTTRAMRTYMQGRGWIGWSQNSVLSRKSNSRCGGGRGDSCQAASPRARAQLFCTTTKREERQEEEKAREVKSYVHMNACMCVCVRERDCVYVSACGAGTNPK